MFEQRELRSRREERMENGVKNLKGARLFPKTFSNNGNGDAYFRIPNIRIRDFFVDQHIYFKDFAFKSTETSTLCRNIISPDQIDRRLRRIFAKIENIKKLIPDQHGFF